MWYMLLEPKLRVYPNLLHRAPVAGHVVVHRAPVSRKAGDSFLDRLREKLREARLRRRAINELAGLDDRLLDDIGLERARIPETVDAMLHREPVAAGGGWRSDAEPKPRDGGDFFLVRMFRNLTRARVRRRAINGLARLDDRLLRDIGLERDLIPDAVDAMLRRRPAPRPSAAAPSLVADGLDADARDPAPGLAAA